MLMGPEDCSAHAPFPLDEARKGSSAEDHECIPVLFYFITGSGEEVIGGRLFKPLESLESSRHRQMRMRGSS